MIKVWWQMRLSPSSSEIMPLAKGRGVIQEEIFITPSDVIEYLFCPRFIYYMRCLDIPQHEDKRYKVMKGREVHEEKAKINREYLRKKLGCVAKDISVYLTSSVLHLKGEVDEVLSSSDGTLAPLDYKFAEYKDWVFQTQNINLLFMHF